MSADTSHKAIVLAGGTGSRLHPVTAVTSKQLVGVFDKPLIYYPLTTLLIAGVRDVLLISNPEHLPSFRAALSDGSQWGIRIDYLPQHAPDGIAQALIIGEEFLGDDPSILVLGDNIVYGRYDFLRKALSGAGDHATIFAYHVDDPSQYGVVEFDEAGQVLSLVEKPAKPASPWAVPGLYIYPPGVADEARKVTPSARGELEITDLHLRYLEQGRLQARRMGRGTAWFDTGTPQDLLEAGNFIEAIQRRQGLLVGSPEEAAYRVGLIDEAEFRANVDALPQCQYRDYLIRVLEDTE